MTKPIGGNFVHTLQSVQTRAKEMQGIPNLITGFDDLRKNVTYTLLFTYPGNIKWKSAVAVVMTPDLCVADIIPHSEKLEPFNFPEKDRLLAPGK